MSVGYEIKKFTATDWRNLTVQLGQRIDHAIGLSDPNLELVADLEHSFTLVKDGIVLGCAGLIPIWEGRAAAWLILSDAVHHKEMRHVHVEVMRFLEMAPYRRIETTVDSVFKQAHRWAMMLGFKLEGKMKSYDPTGRDCWLYARVK